MTGGQSPGRNSPATDKAEQARRRAEQAIEELAAQLEAGNSTTLDAYLRAVGRFHRYSIGNLFLILSQRPDATRVAGFHTWKTLGRSVKKGEKGIAIFAPMVLKRQEEQTTSDEPEQKPPVRFRVVHVFDLSQTEGDPLPEFARVGGDPGTCLQRLEAAVIRSGIELETREHLGGADGLSAGGRIVLRSGLPPADRFSVLAHEWGHEILHKVPAKERPGKTVRETEAEAVAFAVCQAVGLKTGRAAADYIRLYQGDKALLLASLERIQKTACRIIEAIQPDDPHEVERSLPTAAFAHGRQR